MSDSKVTLSQLVDFALRSPEVGTVNFNAIHTILQTIVSKTGLASVMVDDKRKSTYIKEEEKKSISAVQQITGEVNSQSILDKLNEVLSAQAEMRAEIEELSGQFQNLQDAAGESIPHKNLSNIVDLKSQLAEMTLAYNKSSDAPAGGVTSFGMSERLLKIENEIVSQRDQLGELQVMLAGRVSQLVKQVDDIEKDLGIINERMNVQSQSHLGNIMSTSRTSISQSGVASNSVIERDVGHLVADLYSKVNSMTQDLDSMVQATTALTEDKDNLEFRFETMKEEVEVLKTIKADKMEIEDIIAGKADANQLLRKVSHDDFKATVQEFNLTLSDAFAKLQQHEEEWHADMESLQKDIETKMDKSEIIPIKEYLTENVQILIEKVKVLSQMRNIEDAAGAKKKIIRDLNCISCDNDVVMKQQLDGNDVKPPDKIKAHQSIKPFLTYKLDQVRKQQQKLPAGRNLLHFEEMMHDADPRQIKQPPPAPIVQVDSALHICNRYCGGNHTITTPLQRVTRTGNFLTEFVTRAAESPRQAEPVVLAEEIPANTENVFLTTSPIMSVTNLPAQQVQ